MRERNDGLPSSAHSTTLGGRLGTPVEVDNPNGTPVHLLGVAYPAGARVESRLHNFAPLLSSDFVLSRGMIVPHFWRTPAHSGTTSGR